MSQPWNNLVEGEVDDESRYRNQRCTTLDMVFAVELGGLFIYCEGKKELFIYNLHVSAHNIYSLVS